MTAPARRASSAISSTGWITPISLLTNIAATNAKCGVEVSDKPLESLSFDIGDERARYAGEISANDESLGALLGHLDAKGQGDSTLVILTSVPVAAAGGVAGIAVLNLFKFQPLDMLTLLGFVILAGACSPSDWPRRRWP